MADPEHFSPGTVYFVLIETTDGEVFFPGNCGDENLRIPLQAELGPESDALLAGLPLIAPADVRDYLGIVDPEPEVQDPDRLILDPETLDASVLEPLTLIGIYLKTNGTISDGTLTTCTHIPAGWNECVIPDERRALWRLA